MIILLLQSIILSLLQILVMNLTIKAYKTSFKSTFTLSLLLVNC
jgi:hypothetical protein